MRLVRNSEDRNPAGTVGGLLGDRSKAYDPTAYGGTCTLVYDERRRRLVEDFVSLNGTTVELRGRHRVPARVLADGRGGGRRARPRATPRRASPSATATCSRRRWTATPGELEPGVPLTAAGRFCHEAAAVDQRTGVVYETEDPGSGIGAGFYRYTPDDPDDLDGGREAATCSRSPGSRTWTSAKAAPAARRCRVSWVRIDEPGPGPRAALGRRQRTFNQGWAKGGAKFNRLEGCWEDDGTIFFVSTSGGDVKNGDVNSDGYAEGFGQVWAYRPGSGGGTLMLVYESPGGGRRPTRPTT